MRQSGGVPDRRHDGRAYRTSRSSRKPSCNDGASARGFSLQFHYTVTTADASSPVTSTPFELRLR